MRHCAATLSLAAGLHMKAIQKLLGHSSYSLTADTYTSRYCRSPRKPKPRPPALVPRSSPARRDVTQEPEERPDVPSEDGEVPTEDAA
ncbi:hypothetical protein OHB56_18195 [Streptomyces sp. NBC_01635]|nr:hypothetical protein OHB56_18195 [Streptomyces sp. NBC_01635]